MTDSRPEPAPAGTKLVRAGSAHVWDRPGSHYPTVGATAVGTTTG